MSKDCADLRKIAHILSYFMHMGLEPWQDEIQAYYSEEELAAMKLPEDYLTLSMVEEIEDCAYLDDGYAEIRVICRWRDRLWCIEGTTDRDYNFQPNGKKIYPVRKTVKVVEDYVKDDIKSAWWTRETEKKLVDLKKRIEGKDPYRIILELEGAIAAEKKDAAST